MSLSLDDCIVPVWPAPPNVKAIITTRPGGVSRGSLSSLNLGRSVGDCAEAVDENRRRFSGLIGAEPRWMNQVHGIEVAQIDDLATREVVTADAATSRHPGQVCAVMTADCLPVLLADRAGTTVAVAHAGWRGLAAGILEKTLSAMHVAPEEVVAYLGPAIGPLAFEVGDDVHSAFLAQCSPLQRAETLQAFAATTALAPGKWLADIYGLARLRLSAAGVPALSIGGGDFCTYTDEARFFSYRRETHARRQSGRLASAIWLA